MEAGVDYQSATTLEIRPEELAAGVRTLQQAVVSVRTSVNRVIVGKEATIDLLLIALLSEGHALIEDVPGLGKTVMAKSLARSLGISFARIQGTVDLLPARCNRRELFQPETGGIRISPRTALCPDCPG